MMNNMMNKGVLVLAIGLALSGCDTSNYSFKIDKSISIASPKARSEVSLPVTVRWTDTKPPAQPRVAPRDPKAEYYAVFLDRSALSPGKRLESLVDRKTQCQPEKGCPTAAMLSDLRVYLVAKPVLALDFLADQRASSRGDSKDVHEVTIVRMRGDRRLGEAAFLQTFFVRR